MSSQFDVVRSEIWHRVGATVAAFHTAGICHADLNAHNILIDHSDAVHLIDFDRGSVRVPGSWMGSNLKRLSRSLVKLGGPSPTSQAWQALLDGYDEVRRAPFR